jgi:deoxyribose-phosphate aldolase
VARRELAGSTVAAVAAVAVASVVTAFPSGRAPPTIKLADVAAAVEAGVHEMDIVIDRA